MQVTGTICTVLLAFSNESCIKFLLHIDDFVSLVHHMPTTLKWPIHKMLVSTSLRYISIFESIVQRVIFVD